MEQSRFADCVKKMQSGDREGLKLIYEEYVGYIYTVVYGILPSKEDAEDVTSEFFIHLWDIKDKIKNGKVANFWRGVPRLGTTYDFGDTLSGESKKAKTKKSLTSENIVTIER